MIFSLFLSLIIVLFLSSLKAGIQKNSYDYTYSTYKLESISKKLYIQLTENNYNNLNDYKKIFSKYYNDYSKYKLNFIITDEINNKIYSFKNTSSNLDLKKSNIYTMKIVQNSQFHTPIYKYYDFTYKLPLQITNKLYTLWVIASPINLTNDIPSLNIYSLIQIFILSIIIFYIITTPKVKYLKEICEGLKTISSGNLKFKIRKKGHDELYTIAENINHMSNELEIKATKEKELEASKQELITNVAHDIRNPLTSIIGFLEIVENNEYKSAEDMKKYIKISLKESKRMQKLTNDLFTFTKLNNKNVKLNLQPVYINELIYQIIDDFLPKFDQSNLTLVYNITSEKMLINIDINMFVRALSNLLYNSINYSSQPSDVTLSLIKDNENSILSISNKCDNLNQNNVKMLFQRFYRVDNSNNGSGLGLSIAKSIIERHGGKIEAKYNDGTICFSIILKKA